MDNDNPDESFDSVEMQLKIGVMGGAGSDISPVYRQRATELDEAVAEAGCTMITGACPGLPLAAARGACRYGGMVIGTSPALSLDDMLTAMAHRLWQAKVHFSGPPMQVTYARSILGRVFRGCTITIALRRRRRGQGPPVAVGQWVEHIRKHWQHPDFKLAREHPWIPSVREHLKANRPLKAERQLLRATWDRWVGLSDRYYFSFERILLYLARWEKNFSRTLLRPRLQAVLSSHRPVTVMVASSTKKRSSSTPFTCSKTPSIPWTPPRHCNASKRCSSW